MALSTGLLSSVLRLRSIRSGPEYSSFSTSSNGEARFETQPSRNTANTGRSKHRRFIRLPKLHLRFHKKKDFTPSSPDAREEESLSAVSGAARITLTALKDAASLAPVPYIGEAAELALGIWEAVQSTRDTRTSLLALGEYAISLVASVCEEVLQRHPQNQEQIKDQELHEEGENSGMVKLDSRLDSNLEILYSTLQEIRDFVVRTVSRNAIRRFLAASLDAKKVTEYQGKLKNALNLFSFQLNMTTGQIISRIEAQQKALVAAQQSHARPPYFLSDSEAPHSPSVIGTEAGASATQVRAMESAALAFPAIFSFAGATIHAGGAKSSHHRSSAAVKSRVKDDQAPDTESVSHEAEGSDKGKSVDLSSSPSDSDLINSDNVAFQGGAIKFTAVTGGQNSTVVNDYSRRSNYGNVYNSVNDLNMQGPVYSDPSVSGTSLTAFQHRKNDWPPDFYDAPEEQGDYYDHSFRSSRPVSSQTFYDSNGVPTAIPHHFNSDYYGQSSHPSGRTHLQTYYDENGVHNASVRGGRGRRGYRNY